jgi:hypothetical protein
MHEDLKTLCGRLENRYNIDNKKFGKTEDIITLYIDIDDISFNIRLDKRNDKYYVFSEELSDNGKIDINGRIKELDDLLKYIDKKLN